METLPRIQYTPALIKTVTTQTYTLQDGDEGFLIRFTNVGQVTVTLPTDATEYLDDGFQCVLASEGAGGLTLSTTGITLPGSPNTTIVQGEAMVPVRLDEDTWGVYGGTL